MYFSKLKATPEKENFTGKYINQSKIATKLVDNYFKSVNRLIQKSLNLDYIENSLEIGCGEGFSTLQLRKLLPTTIKFEASEYLGTQVIEAQKRNPTVQVNKEDVYRLNREDKTVGLIFLLEVLEHLDHPIIALNEIKRINKNSGYLILGVPREPIWRILNMFRLKYIKDLGNTPGHLNHWTSKSLIKLIEQNYGSVLAVENPLPWTIILAKKS